MVTRIAFGSDSPALAKVLKGQSRFHRHRRRVIERREGRSIHVEEVSIWMRGHRLDTTRV